MKYDTYDPNVVHPRDVPMHPHGIIVAHRNVRDYRLPHSAIRIIDNDRHSPPNRRIIIGIFTQILFAETFTCAYDWLAHSFRENQTSTAHGVTSLSADTRKNARIFGGLLGGWRLAVHRTDGARSRHKKSTARRGRHIMRVSNPPTSLWPTKIDRTHTHTHIFGATRDVTTTTRIATVARYHYPSLFMRPVKLLRSIVLLTVVLAIIMCDY